MHVVPCANERTENLCTEGMECWKSVTPGIRLRECRPIERPGRGAFSGSEGGSGGFLRSFATVFLYRLLLLLELFCYVAIEELEETEDRKGGRSGGYRSMGWSPGGCPRSRGVGL